MNKKRGVFQFSPSKKHSAPKQSLPFESTGFFTMRKLSSTTFSLIYVNDSWTRTLSLHYLKKIQLHVTLNLNKGREPT